MKKLILSLALIVAVGFVSAQSLTFVSPDGTTTYTSGQRIVCTDANAWGEMQVELKMSNNTANPMSVIISRDTVSLVSGTLNYFCWGQCLGPEVNISDPVAVPANSVSTDAASFHQMLDVNGTGTNTPGTSVMVYTAYDRNDPTNMTVLEIWFAYNAQNVNESAVRCDLGAAYPNPAKSTVRFDYNISNKDNASIVVYNLLGQKVKSQTISGTQGQAIISVDDMQEGMYFCNLIINGNAVKTEKFIVKK